MKLKFKKMPELGGKNYRAENIKEVNPTYEGPVVAIELFYMSAASVGSRSVGWTVIRLDAEGDQVGGGWYHWRKYDAVYDANMSARHTDALNDRDSGGW